MKGRIIKTYESFNLNENLENLNLGRFKEKIDKSLLKLNDDGTYDYDGDLSFSNMGLNSLSEIPIRFRKVVGHFSCSQNQLTSLLYGPSSVDGSFSCSNNKLTNLRYAPSYVGGNFSCSFNNLTSLKGAPLEVGGSFHCDHNKLNSLLYAPQKNDGSFYCHNNNLISKVHLSKIGRTSYYGNNPFSITDEVIESVKQMTYEQQMEELDFFEQNDSNAFEMMKEILDSLGVNYGPETRSMVGVMKGYTNAKEMF